MSFFIAARACGARSGKTPLISGVAIIGGVLAVASPARAQEIAQPSGGLQEIVVTAQKREENLQDVPVAVTALDQEAVDRLQVHSFSSLSGLAPNLTVTTALTGSAPSITIRGIVGANQTNGTDAAVALYVDGIYISRYPGSAFDVADLERVEVLRGPQGTLYGRNTTGGAISFITAAPKGEFYARQEVTGGSLGRFRTKTRIDLPSFGDFSISGTFLHDEERGWVRNSQVGTRWNFENAMRGLMDGDRSSPRYLGGRNTEAGRIAVRYAPAELPLTVDYRFDRTDAEFTNNPIQALGFSPTAGGATVASVYALQSAVGGEGVISLDRLKAVPNGYTTPERLKAFGHSLAVAVDLSDALKFKSITGYRGFRDEVSVETGGDGTLIDPFGSTGNPYRVFASIQFERSRQFSQELQLSYSSPVIDAIGGLFYFQENTLSRSANSVLQTVVSDPLINSARNRPDATARNRSYAAFGQVTAHLTDELDVTAGVRGTRDDRRTDSRTVLNGVAVPGFKGRFEHVDWTANVTYRPDRDLTFYAKAGSGYLSGGVYNGRVFDPEHLVQYEVGAKTELFDKRVRLNASAFRSDYRDLQTVLSIGGIANYFNVGEARIYGGEAELTALPTDNLTLSANYGYTKFKYLEFILGGVDVADERAPILTPKHNVSLSGEYRFPELASGLRPSINVDARWHSKIHYVSGNYDPDLASALLDNDFWDVDARATLGNIDMRGATGRLSLWVKNALDKRKLIRASDLSTIVTGTFNRPRTYGVDVSVEF